MLTIDWMPKSSRKQSSHLPKSVITSMELGYDNCAAAPESKTSSCKLLVLTYCCSLAAKQPLGRFPNPAHYAVLGGLNQKQRKAELSLAAHAGE
jgi:hypothetical protein